MPHRSFAALVLVPLALGCASASQRAAEAQNQAWLKGQTVAVRQFDTETTIASGLTGSMKGIGNEVANKIAKRLQGEGVKATVIKEGVASDAGVLVEGKVDRLFLGDARRVFWGDTSGTATCALSGSVTSGDRTVGEFHAKEVTRLGMLTSDYMEMLEECLYFVSAAVADQILQNRYEGPRE